MLIWPESQNTDCRRATFVFMYSRFLSDCKNCVLHFTHYMINVDPDFLTGCTRLTQSYSSNESTTELNSSRTSSTADGIGLETVV